MKLLLKLIVVVVVINAAYHIGMAEYRFSQMKDAHADRAAEGSDAAEGR